MKTFFDLAQTRRSTRKFRAQAVPQDVQEALQNTVLMSPASKRSNPWEFIFVENKETLEAISESKQLGAALIKDAPLAVVVLADTEKSDVWIEDASIATIYLQLAAEDLGLGSCWVQMRKRAKVNGEDASAVLKNLLNIPAQYEVLSVVAIGYKDEDKKPFDLTRLQTDKIHKERF